MAGKYRYVNSNPYPVIVPCPRGGNVTIKPGESTTNDWYGRFCGQKKLTRMPIDAKVKSGGGPVAKPPVTPATTGMSFKPKPVELKDQETETYTMRRGIYQCKLCDTFRTGSLDSFNAHLREYHGRPAGNEQGTPTVMTSRRATPPPAAELNENAPLPVPEPTPEPEPVVEAAPEPPVASEDVETTEDRAEKRNRLRKTPMTPSEEGFRCPHPGCGRVFKTERGLRTHIGRSHPKS